MFRDRSTTDVLLLLIAGTVCLVVVLAEATISVIRIKDPGTDTTAAGNAVEAVINTLIGLLAGFLAGRTETSRRRRLRDDDEEEP